MSSPFSQSVFHRVLQARGAQAPQTISILGGLWGSSFRAEDRFLEKPVVVFDFETTGLNVRSDRIIEIGAIKYIQKEEVDRFSCFVNPEVALSQEITRITGIKDHMLSDALTIHGALPKFHQFLKGCIGLAHNAEFDVGMLFYESLRLGIVCDYTIFCSLKMARRFLHLERRNLDALAEYYGLTFEARHRAIDDIRVTAQVVWKMMDENPHLQTVADFEPFREGMPG